MPLGERSEGGGGGRHVPEVPVYAYWDYACPFSYVGTHRLRRLAARTPLRIHWRPLELGGGRPRGGREAWEEAAAEIEELARSEGLPLRLPAEPLASGPALQAAEFARDLGEAAFLRLHEALFHAYFVEGVDLGRRASLLEVAEAAGVDREGLSAALEDARYEEELGRAREEAARYGIDGTPSYLFGRFKVVGAAPMAALRRAADRAARESVSED